MAPFATEDRRKRLHKKSLSSISLSSMISKKDEPSPSAPGSPRGSFDISGALRDLMLPNRNNAERAPSPQKPNHQKKPSKSKSAIDISILRKKATSEDKKEKGVKDQKENKPREPLVPLSPRSIHGLFTRSQNHPVDLPAEDLFAPPKIYTRSPRPGLTPQGSDSSISIVGQPARKSTSSEDRMSAPRRAETEELMKRYTPTDYTPANQRNFNYEPALLKPAGRDDAGIPLSREGSGDGSKTREKKPRPKSEFFSSTSNRGAFSILSPRKSYEMRRPEANPSADAPKEAKTSPTHSFSSKESSKVSAGLDLAGIDTAFEELLVSRGVPENMKDDMRALDVRIKQDFLQKDRQAERAGKEAEATLEAPTLTSSITHGLGIFKRPKTANSGEEKPRPKSKGKDSIAPDQNISPIKKLRPRSRTFGSSKDKDAPSNSGGTKRSKGGDDKISKGKIFFPPSSTSAVPTVGSTSPASMATLQPEEWVHWLRENGTRKNFGHGLFAEDDMPEFEKNMQEVDVAVLHKLRLVLRNETLRWVESFTKLGGMEAIWAMIERVLGVEWREDHEDKIFHELLLCLKGLCTASTALQKLAEMASTIFPRLLDSLFDEEKKGPCEFTTRGIIISLLFVHLQTCAPSQRSLRARRILSYLADKKLDAKKRPLDFIEIAHVNRPYRRWCKEVVNVTKEVFWIFLHGANIVPLIPRISNSTVYSERNFPQDRPPVPAGATVGGVEWEATSYLAVHLDLLNGCISSLVTRDERNDLRADLKNSGWERTMGGALRLCKESIHTAVHEGLKTWVRAAEEDEWYVGDVRFGPRMEQSRPASPIKPRKKKEDPPPKLELGLGLDLGGENGSQYKGSGLGGWEY
ncbi:armadillo-type protein [Pyronema omphalodes]|nr:armadillo-type protein [Pyronema omphalodes]